MKTTQVKVHRKGPTSSAKMEWVYECDGKYYIKHNQKWWMLSNGSAGYHSINVGLSSTDPVSLRLEEFAKTLDREVFVQERERDEAVRILAKHFIQDIKAMCLRDGEKFTKEVLSMCAQDCWFSDFMDKVQEEVYDEVMKEEVVASI